MTLLRARVRSLVVGLCAVALLVTCSSGDSTNDSAAGLSLMLSASEVRPGETFTLILHGTHARRAVGGVSTVLEAKVGDRWSPAYILLSPISPEEEPSFVAASEPYSQLAVGIPGDKEQVVLVPPAPPGKYRVAKEYTLRGDGDRPRRVVFHAEVTIRE